MNIMFLIFSHNVGGIERLLIDLANHMTDYGHKLHLCIINDDYSADLLKDYRKEVIIHALHRPINSHHLFKYMIQLARIIKQNHIDILHCQGINCVVFSIPAKLYSPRIKIFDTVHDTHTFIRYSSWKIVLEKILCKKIIAISNSVKQEILKRNVTPSKIQIIYNAIDTAKFHADACKSIHRDSIVIGNVARIVPSKKGQMLLLQAMDMLVNKYPHIHCKFAGKILPEFHTDYQRMLDFIEEHHLTDNVTFCGSLNDIPTFLKSLDIFVLPSYFEGFGISLIEAMSMGLPCIASNIDGPSEIIQTEELGLLFQVGNVNDLTQKIVTAIEQYDTFNVQKISEYINIRFSIHTMVERLLEVYNL